METFTHYNKIFIRLTDMYVQFGFLYLIMTGPQITMQHTDKKENQIFLIYREIKNGAACCKVIYD